MDPKFLFFGLILITYIVNTRALDESCVKLGEICNDDSKCCNKLDRCYLSVHDHVSRCEGDGLLGSSCKYPIDCSKILGGSCENGVCDCKSDHKKYNRHRCKPNYMKPGVRWHD